jgi:hypothetical protein
VCFLLHWYTLEIYVISILLKWNCVSKTIWTRNEKWPQSALFLLYFAIINWSCFSSFFHWYVSKISFAINMKCFLIGLPTYCTQNIHFYYRNYSYRMSKDSVEIMYISGIDTSYLSNVYFILTSIHIQRFSTLVSRCVPKPSSGSNALETLNLALPSLVLSPKGKSKIGGGIQSVPCL